MPSSGLKVASLDPKQASVDPIMTSLLLTVAVWGCKVVLNPAEAALDLKVAPLVSKLTCTLHDRLDSDTLRL